MFPKEKLVILVSLVASVLAGCDVSNGVGGVSLHCNDKFVGKDVSLDVQLKICRENPKVSIAVDVDALDIHLKEEGDASITIPVEPLGELQLSLTTEGDNGDVDVAIIFKPPFIPIPITVFKQTVQDDNCNALLYWFNSQSEGVYIGIGVAVLGLLVACCCCCYRCCCRRRTPPVYLQPPPTMCVIQSGMEGVAPLVSNVPYHRHVNEII